MTLRISQFAGMCGLSVVALSGVMFAQAPRYQSPLNLPASPQPQLTLPVPAAITPNGTVVEDVIVHVNDQIITRSDVERAAQQLAQENQQANTSPAEVAERQKNFLRDLIDKQLLLSRAKELSLNVDTEVIHQLDDIRKQNHMDSMEDLERAAQSQGISFEDFKAQIRNGLLTQRVVQEEVGRRLQMTQAQEQAYYEAHKQEYAQPEQIRLSEILVPTAADANDAAIAQAQAKADDVVAKLKGGANFEELAKTYSGGPGAAQGGDLGLYKRGVLPKVFEDQSFGLKVGEVTAPIRSRQGFVILKVTEHQPAGIPPLKDVEQQVQEAMYSEQMQPAVRTYLTKLREDAALEVAPGFVDSGASPKQVKIVNLAYQAPVVKKKKKEEKRRFERAGHFSTANAKPGEVGATAVAAAAPAPTPTIGKNGKPKKFKREKVRFGQAPRNSLPAGPEETASGTDVGAGATSVAKTPDLAPGTAIAPVENNNQVAADADPFATKTVDEKKTRFSDRAKTAKADKAKAQTVKVKEKALTTVAPVGQDVRAEESIQSSALGLNGDMSKKKKKKEKVKGAPKERLQNKAPAPPAAPLEETPAKAPDRGTPREGILPKQTPVGADTPATPPAAAPAGGQQKQDQPK